jgi:hypothetical protein
VLAEGAVEGAAETGADNLGGEGAGEMALVEEGVDFVAFLEAGDARACAENCPRRIGARDDR